MLETTRLYFRPYGHKDFQFYLQMWQDKDMVRFIGTGEIRDKAHLKANFPYWISRSSLGKGVLLMLLRRTSKPIGHAGLVPQVVDGKNEMEIGYWVAKQHWNYGYATESACLFRDIAFRELGINRVVSIIQPENVQSIRVAEKMGMDLCRKTIFKDQPVLLYAMTRPPTETKRLR